MSEASLLGVSVLELRTDAAPLEAGLASAQRHVDASTRGMQAAIDTRMTSIGGSFRSAVRPIGELDSGLGSVARTASAAELRMKNYELQVQAAQVQVNRLSAALEANRARQDALNAKLTAGKGDQAALTAQIGQTERAHRLLNDQMQLAQARMGLASERTHTLGAETRSLAAETGVSSRAMKDLYEHMGPVGTTLGDLTTRSRLYREHGLDYAAAGMVGLEAAIVGGSVRSALKFEELGVEIRKQTGLSGRSLDELMGAIRVAARDSPYSLQQVADAAVILRQEFHQTGAEIERNSNLMVAFATAAGQDVRPQMQQLDRIMTDYREPLSNVVGLTDKLTAVSQATQQPISGLTNTLDRFGPKLQALGFNLNDSVRLLGVFQASGIKVDQMGRGLTSVLTTLSKTETVPKDAHLKLEQYGLAVQTAQQRVDALSKELGTTWAGNQAKVSAELDVARGRLDVAKQKYDALNTTLHAARGAHGDVATAIHNEITQITDAHSKQDALNIAVADFGKQLGPAMARAFYDNQAALDKVDKALHRTGATQGLYAADAHSLHGEVARMKNTFNDLGIEIGTAVVPALTSVAHWTAGAIHQFDKLYKKNKDLVDIIAGSGGLVSALVLLSRHSPLGDILGPAFAKRGHSTIGNLLSGNSGGTYGVRGASASGSLTNPVAVWVTNDTSLGSGFPSKNVPTPGENPPKPPASGLKRVLEELKGAAKTLTPIGAIVGAQTALEPVTGPNKDTGVSPSNPAGNLSGDQRDAQGMGGSTRLMSTVESLVLGGRLAGTYPTPVGVPGRFSAVTTGAIGGLESHRQIDQFVTDMNRARTAVANLGHGNVSVQQTIQVLQRLSRQAQTLGDTKMVFADRLGAELLKSRTVTSRGVTQLIGQLDRLPPAARGDAADAMIQMTQQLEQQKRLPLGSTTRFVTELLANYQEVRDKGGTYFRGLMTDTGQVMDQLLVKIRTSTGQQRAEALAEYETLRRTTSSKFDDMWSHIKTRQDQMTGKIESGSSQAASSAGQSLYDYAYNVDWAMSSGVVSSTDGSRKIATAMADTIKAFGGKVVPGVVAVEKASIGAGVQNLLGQIKRFERGGLVQFGQEGQRGPDEIPVNFGGVPIIVGAGEKGAVFTGEQQAVADYFLSPIGGLDGLFGTVTTPHSASGYARGGRVPPVRGFAGGGIVTASDFGGPSDPGTGSTGYRGDNLYQHPDSYAELNMGTALGNLPYLTPLDVTYHGRTARLRKRDIGAGGGGLGGRTRAIDLWFQAAQALGFPYPGLDNVQINGPAGVNVNIAGGGAGGGTYTPLSAPTVTGTGTVASMVRLSLQKETDAANAYLAKIAPAGAAGGFAGTAVAMGGGKSGYAFPFPKGVPFSWQRIDQGQDLEGPPGGQILAMAPGIVSQASDRFGGFGPFYATEQITAGPLAGRGVYYGHTKMVRSGRVNAGDVIAVTQPSANDWTAAPAGWLELGFLPYGSMSAGNAIAPILHGIAAGRYARGGFVPFATGGPVATAARTTYPHTPRRPRFPHQTAKGGTSSASGAKPKAIKPAKAKAPSKLPTLKQLPGFDLNLINGLTSLDTEVGRIGNWQSFIESLHGRATVTPTVTITNPDGTTTDEVNWGAKSGLPGTLTGLVDPSTHQPTKGIWDRLREIGAQTDRMSPTAPSLTDTELGIDETLLDDFLRQRTLAATISGEFGPWLTAASSLGTLDNSRVAWLTHAEDTTTPYSHLGTPDFRSLGSETLEDRWVRVFYNPNAANVRGSGSGGANPAGGTIPEPGDVGSMGYYYRHQIVTESYARIIQSKVREYKNLVARIEYLTKRQEELPLEKARRQAAITDRFRRARYEMQRGSIQSGAQLSAYMLSETTGLGAEEKAARDAIPTAPPRSWTGDRAGWTAQRAAELKTISDEFTARKDAIRRAGSQQRLQGRLNALDASYALQTEQAADTLALNQQYGTKTNQIKDELRGDRNLEKADKTQIATWLKQFKTQATTETKAVATSTASGGFRDQLAAYLDPTGTLAINILTKQNIDIPNLLQEIQGLTGTTVANTSGTAGTSAVDSQLLGLEQQRVAMLGQQIAISQAQYQTLSNLGNLPPFGGVFHDGGVVPGPIGAERLVLAQGGERITPVGADLEGLPAPQVNVYIDRKSDLDKLIDLRVENQLRQVGRKVRGLPSRGGGGML